MARTKFSIVTVFLLGACVGLFSQSAGNVRPDVSKTESVSYLLVHIAPNFNLPLGESASYFNVGGGVQVGAEYRFPFFPYLFVMGGLGYDFAPLQLSGQSASFPNAILGAGAQFQVVPWLILQAYVAGGYQYGFLNGSSPIVASGNPCVIGGAGALVPISRLLSIEAGGSYKYLAGSYSGLSFYIGTALHFMTEEVRRAAPLLKEIPKGLSISAVDFKPVFSVLRKYYDSAAVGQIEIKNIDKTPLTNVTVTLFIRKYMDAPRKCVELKELKPGESKTVAMTALFNESILDITEETKVTAEISCTYNQSGAAMGETETPSVRVYGRNSITWDDNRKACAFVTAKDPAVLTFSNNVNSFVKPIMNPAINKNLQAALAIHEALRLYGVSYVANAISYADVTQNKATVDYLKFPRQTFDYRSGDCSDLSILYCALLESMQVETAFITIPGHIFMAVSLGMTPDEARKTFTYTDDLIFREKQTWLPIETTQRSGGFLTAWAEGAKEWRENFGRQQAEFYPVREGWKVYESVQYPGSSPVTVPPQEKVTAAFKQQADQFVIQQISGKVAQLQAKARGSNNSPKILNDLGVLFARYGLYDNAERQFKQVIATTEFVPSLINMGNLSYIRKDTDSALQYFDRACRIDPSNPAVLLGLARANQEAENFGAAKKYYSLLKQADPNLAQQFAYLELKGEEATRAADIGRASEVIIWAEQQ
jgi:tetratricopeptide (TPR) repeat protein